MENDMYASADRYRSFEHLETPAMRIDSYREYVRSQNDRILTWSSPVPYVLVPTDESESFRNMPEGHTGIPLNPHPGAFRAIRKYNVHPGIDLYVDTWTPVAAMEDGEVVSVVPFTGPKIGLDHWHNTDAVLVEWASGVVIYGEIAPFVEVWEKVRTGDLLGHVKRVLRHDKWRPTSMLHLELHVHGTRKWYEGFKKEGVLVSLRDPTPYLLKASMGQEL